MSKRGEEGYIKNPFRVDGIIERHFTKQPKVLINKDMVDQDTGEVTQLFTAPENKVTLHDSRSYAKLFVESGDILRDLSPAAIKTVIYITVNLRVNFDSIYLNTPDVANWGNMADSTAYKAVQELLQQKIIAKKLGSYMEYWINPNIFYNGDRVKLFKYLKQSVK